MMNEMEQVEAQINYPCYKSFDRFIDVEWLKSLDGYVTERVKRHLEAQQDYQFYTGPFRLGDESPDRPGTRMIYLSQSKAPDSYYDLDKTELWEQAPAAEEFPLLMEFIRSLPFTSTGRALIMYDHLPRAVSAHRDHDVVEVCHEFVWFRTNLSKPFYMFDHRTDKKLYVSGYSAWFDTVNQFHGSDPCDGLTFSVRVDGRFSPEFRSLIPRPRLNPASAPALWACASA
jgi:hypothetical protein